MFEAAWRAWPLSGIPGDSLSSRVRIWIASWRILPAMSSKLSHSQGSTCIFGPYSGLHWDFPVTSACFCFKTALPVICQWCSWCFPVFHSFYESHATLHDFGTCLERTISNCDGVEITRTISQPSFSIFFIDFCQFCVEKTPTAQPRRISVISPTVLSHIPGTVSTGQLWSTREREWNLARPSIFFVCFCYLCICCSCPDSDSCCCCWASWPHPTDEYTRFFLAASVLVLGATRMHHGASCDIMGEKNLVYIYIHFSIFNIIFMTFTDEGNGSAFQCINMPDVSYVVPEYDYDPDRSSPVSSPKLCTKDISEAYDLLCTVQAVTAPPERPVSWLGASNTLSQFASHNNYNNI